MNTLNSALLTLGIYLSVIGVAGATIIGASGNAQNPAIPADLSRGQFESGLVSGFDENQGINIAANTIAVDYLISAADVGSQFPGVDFPPLGNPLFLGAGVYDSHLLHFDPDGIGGDVSGANFTFDGAIVGIMANATFLINSDAILGVAGTTYDNHNGRRSERTLNPGGQPDTFTINAVNSISIDWSITHGGHVDDLRVITQNPQSIPEPAILALVGLGLAGLGLTRRHHL